MTAAANTVEIKIRLNQDKPTIKDIQSTYKQSFNSIKTEAKKMYEELKKSGKIDFKKLESSTKRVSKDLGGMANKSTQATRKLEKLATESRKTASAQSNLTRSVKGLIAAYASYLSTASVANFLSGAIKSYAEFDAEIRRAGAAAGLAGSQLDSFRQIARKMGMETRFSATEAASALKYLSMAGLSANEAMKALPVTLQLATAGSMDLGEAADIVTNIMTQYNKKASDMARISDILTKTFTSSNTNLQELGQAFSYAGAIAYSAGQKFTDVATVLGLMANAGFKADRAGTALRESLARLMDAPGEAKKALDRLNVSIYKADGSMRSLIDILYDLKKAGATTADMIQIFGLRAAPAMIAVMNNSKESIEKFREALEKSQGTTKKVADEINGGLDGALKELKSKMDEVRLSIGAAINKDGELIDQLQDLVNWLVANKEKVDELAVSLSHVAAEIVKVIEAVSKFIIEHQKMLKLIGEGVLVLYAWRKVLLLIEAIKASEFILGIAAALKSFKTAAELATVAGRAFLTKVVLPLAIADAAYNIYRLAKAMYEYHEAVKEAEKAEERRIKAEERLKKKLQEVAKQTGYNIKTFKDFEKLIKEHKIVLDETTHTWRRMTEEERKLAEQTKKTTEAQKEQAEKVKIYSQQELLQITENLATRKEKHEQTINRLLEKEKQLKDKVINLQRELVNKINELENRRVESIASIEAQINDIRRKGMDDVSSYYDKLEEADRDYEKAKAALARNNFELYKFYINRYRSLVTSAAGEEIKENNEVAISKQETIETAIDGLEKIKALENEYYARKKEKEREIYQQRIAQVRAQIEAVKLQIKAEQVMVSTILKALSMIDASGKLKIQTNEANKQLSDILKQIDTLEKNIGKKKSLQIDTTEAKTEVEDVKDKFVKTKQQIESSKIKVSVDDKGVIKVESIKKSIFDVSKEADNLNKKKITLNIDTQKANSNIKKVIDDIKNKPIEIAIDDRKAEIKLNNIKTQLNRISDKKVKVDIDTSSLNGLNNLTNRSVRVIPKLDYSALSDLESRIARPVVKMVYIETREKHRLGGIAGFAKGGKLPGYGGGDKIPALLEAGEYVIRKEAVAKYGVSLLNRINSLNFNGTLNLGNSGNYKRFEIKIGDAQIVGYSSEEMIDNFEKALRRRQLCGVENG